MNQVLFFLGIADDVHNKSATFHVERERFGQRQSRRPGNHHHFCSSPASRALGSPRLSQRPSRLVTLKRDRAARDDDDACQDLMPAYPILHPLKPGHGDHGDGGLHRRTGLDIIRQPLHVGKCFAHYSGGTVDILIYIVSDIVGVLSQLGRDMRDLFKWQRRPEVRQRQFVRCLSKDGRDGQGGLTTTSKSCWLSADMMGAWSLKHGEGRRCVVGPKFP